LCWQCHSNSQRYDFSGRSNGPAEWSDDLTKHQWKF
jgi:hypothetical protein